MLLKKITAAVTVAGMATTPIVAHSAPLGTVGTSNARISGPAASSSELNSEGNGTLLILLGLALIAGGVIIATKGNDDDTDQPPVSF